MSASLAKRPQSKAQYQTGIELEARVRRNAKFNKSKHLRRSHGVDLRQFHLIAREERPIRLMVCVLTDKQKTVVNIPTGILSSSLRAPSVPSGSMKRLWCGPNSPRSLWRR